MQNLKSKLIATFQLAKKYWLLLTILVISVIAISIWIVVNPGTGIEVTSENVSRVEIASVLGMSETELGKIDAEKFRQYFTAKRHAELNKQDKIQLLAKLGEQIASAKYPNNFTQAIITEKGGTLENDLIKIEFPSGAVKEPLVISFHTTNSDNHGMAINQSFSLQAETITGKEVKQFQTNIFLTSKNAAESANTATYYFNEESKTWSKVNSRVLGNDVIAFTDHFSTYTNATTTPKSVPEVACGVFVDDSFNFNPQTELCFSRVGLWEAQQVGVYQTSLFSNNPFAFANWKADHTKLEGRQELSAVIPDIPSLRKPGEDEASPDNYAVQAQYLILHDAGIERVGVKVDLSKPMKNIVSLKSYSFNETAAEVILWGFTIEGASTDKYIVADAICFGPCEEGAIGDLRPPRIEEVQPQRTVDGFIIAADVTDAESGVGKVYLSLEGKLYEMINVGGNRYEVKVTTPIQDGKDLNYYIIAYDKVNNKSQWSPKYGYVTRANHPGIGIPPESENFVRFKREYLGRVQPAKAGLDPCNQCVGDPVNMQNGNLLEQMEVAKIAGRASIDFNLQYNSLGGVLGIFGENWTHSYNYKVLEFSKEAYVTYPGGNTQEFKLENGSYKATNPYLADRLSKEGDTFTLTQSDQTKIKFDTAGDVVRIEDLSTQGLDFEYSEQDPNINFSKLTKIRADGGRELTLSYNDKGLVSELTLPGNKVVKFTYSEADDLISVVDEKGSETKYEYDRHVVVKKYSPEGHTYYVNEVDAKRRITKQTVGDNTSSATTSTNTASSFTQTYEYQESKTIVRDSNGTVATYNFNDEGLMTGNTDEINSKTSFQYDENRRITSETNAEGRETAYAYDERGNQTYVKSADGSELKREFNEQNQLTKETNELGATTSFQYDERGNLVKATDALGNTSEYFYNSENQLILSRDARGAETRYAYTTKGDLDSTTDALGGVTKFSYDWLGRRTAETNPRGFTTSYFYDATGNLTEVSKPENVTEKFQYDANNRLISHTDPKGNTTSFSHDTKENLISKTDALGNVTRFQYGGMNEKLAEVDPLGRITSYSYSEDYLVNQIISAKATTSEVTTRYSYNKLNQPLELIDGEGRVTKYQYDELGRKVAEIKDANGLAAKTTFNYDSASKLISTVNANGNTTSFHYDALGRVLEQVDALGGTTRFSYDANGNLTRQTDAKGSTTTYSYDKLNRKVTETNAKGFSTTFSYDAHGNLTATTDAQGLKVEHSYDGLDRLVKKVTNPSLNPFGSDTNLTETYSYDLNSNLTSQTNPRGQTTKFSYDPLNRITTITDPLGSTTSFSYDALSNTTAVTDRNGNVSRREYDELNRVVGDINALGKAQRFSYDDVGNLTKFTDRKGNSTTYSYNGLNQQTKIVDALNEVTSFQYDKLGNRLSLTDANSHTSKFSYDALARLTSQTNAEGHTTTTTYDAVSNPTSIRDAKGNTTSYQYDELHRLVAEINAAGGKTSYSYDLVGNKLTETDPNSHTDTFAYDPVYRLIRQSDAEGNSTHFQYDQNANLTKQTDANGNATSYSYDTLDRLVKEVNPKGETKVYGYDKETNITAETAADGVVTGYDYSAIYELSRVIMNQQTANGENQTAVNTDVSSNVDTAYSYDANSNLISIREPKGNTTSFIYDALNRQVRETNALGNSWNFGYDPVGNKTSRVDANGKLTTYSYYPDNMLRSISYADGTSVVHQYDQNNNRTTTKDTIGTTVSAYDELNRITNTVDSLKRKLSYNYDQVGNITKLIYPDSKEVSYSYFKNDWLKTTSADGLTTQYAYDYVGNLVRQVNPNNTFSSYKYDPENLVTNIVNMASGRANSTFSYSYDNVGQRTRVEKTYGWQQPEGVVSTYQHDAIRRLTSSTDTSSRGSITNSYSYDRNSNRVAWSSNDNERTPKPFDKADLSYEYDNINALIRITERGEQPAPQQPSSSTTSATTSSGTTSSTTSAANSFTKRPRQVTVNNPKVSNSFIASLRNFQTYLETQKGKQITDKAYTEIRSRVNALLSKAEDGMLTRSEATKWYEEMVKLIDGYLVSKDIKAPGVANSLKVKLEELEDTIPSLPTTVTKTVTTQETVPVAPTPTANPNKPVDRPQPNKPQTPKPHEIKEILFSYDRNGNRVERLIKPVTGPNEKTTYNYDLENRLTQVRDYNPKKPYTTNMQYDGLGRRLVKTTGPNPGTQTHKTEFVFWDMDQVAEYNILNSSYTHFYRDTHNKILSNQVFTTDGAKDKYYYHYDALNSVVGLTKADGQSNKNYRYHDFGSIDDNNTQRSDSTGGTNTDPHNHYTYTGIEWDEHMEIYEFYSRGYDPEHGVWLQQDSYRGEPQKPQSLLRYKYVEQNPINQKDYYGYSTAALIPTNITNPELLKTILGTLGTAQIAVEVTGVTSLSSLLTLGSFAAYGPQAVSGRVYIPEYERLNLIQTHAWKSEKVSTVYNNELYSFHANGAVTTERGCFVNAKQFLQVQPQGWQVLDVILRGKANVVVQKSRLDGVAGFAQVDPDDLPKVLTNETEYVFTNHAYKAMLDGGLTVSDVVNTINNGSSIRYRNNKGNVTGYRTPDGTYVAVGDNGMIITVIENTSSNYLTNVLNNPNYIPIK